MKHRVLTSLGITALAVPIAIVFVAPVRTAAQSPKTAAPSQKTAAAKPAAQPWVMPRTADGAPDLQGYWTNNSYTPLERPQGVEKEFYTLEELRAVEKKNAEREEEQTTPGTVADVHY